MFKTCYSLRHTKPNPLLAASAERNLNSDPAKLDTQFENASIVPNCLTTDAGAEHSNALPEQEEDDADSAHRGCTHIHDMFAQLSPESV